MDVPPPPIDRRLKAARALMGIRSTRELAEKIPAGYRLGDKTLRKIETGKRSVEKHELDALAAAVGLPVAFFTIDFSRLTGLEFEPEYHRQTGAAEMFRFLIRALEDDERQTLRNWLERAESQTEASGHESASQNEG